MHGAEMVILTTHGSCLGIQAAMLRGNTWYRKMESQQHGKSSEALYVAAHDSAPCTEETELKTDSGDEWLLDPTKNPPRPGPLEHGHHYSMDSCSRSPRRLVSEHLKVLLSGENGCLQKLSVVFLFFLWLPISLTVHGKARCILCSFRKSRENN